MILSYNENKSRRLELQHIFIPNVYGAISEVIIAFLALIMFNISTLNRQLLTKNLNDIDALPLWRQVIRRMLDSLHSHPHIEQMMLFALWAIMGATLYIVVFRLLQAAFGIKHSVGIGLRFVRKDHTLGILHWLASLHDFFLAIVIGATGTFTLSFGILFCFGYASRELQRGVSAAYPDNIKPLLLSGLLAVISVRFAILGLSLLFRRFRNWYNM